LGGLDLTLIDPALDDLRNLFGPRGSGAAHHYSAPVQNVPLEVFARLESSDILFIDSSHILKTGSDVNHYLFEILPILQPGVLVHIHDILYPFEYPEAWVLEDKRSWNEAYALRAFLEYNSAFEIVYWNNFVWRHLRDDLAALMPFASRMKGEVSGCGGSAQPDGRQGCRL
jgi:hypothetical protein